MGVFALFTFHCYIVMIGLTTQEKLKHMYDRFEQSPFAYKSCFTEWAKVVCCPQKIKSRITHELDLKSNKPKEFDEVCAHGKEHLPTELQEESVEIYSEAFKEPKIVEPFIPETGHQRQGTIKREKIKVQDWASVMNQRVNSFKVVKSP
jgi:hypothetical protein